jgi:hypothetical protein
MKFWISLNPIFPLFSGWNCTPKTFPFEIIDGKISPCSVVATISVSSIGEE